MIARLWHGWTLPENADSYERLLKSEVLPAIGKMQGCRGFYLFRQDSAEEAAFVTLLFFESLEAVRKFAGPDYETAVVPPEARKLLCRFDARSEHYQVLAAPIMPGLPS